MPSTIYGVLIADVLESRARQIFAACSEESLLPSQNATCARSSSSCRIPLPPAMNFRPLPATCRRSPPSFWTSAGHAASVAPDRLSASAAFPTAFSAG